MTRVGLELLEAVRIVVRHRSKNHTTVDTALLLSELVNNLSPSGHSVLSRNEIFPFAHRTLVASTANSG